MKYKTHNQDDLISISGTHLMGRIDLRFHQIAAALGDPLRLNEAQGDGKIRIQWVIKFDDGQVATIYDWKEYNRESEDVTDWHIGGRSFEVVQRVCDILQHKETALTY